MFKGALSFKKLNVYQICAIAMLIAVTAILSQISGHLRIGNFSKLSISFISVYIAAAAFGPVAGGVVGAMADIISYVANPTGAYIFWFTLIEFINGFLFGLFFYRSEIKQEKKWFFVVKAVLCVLSQFAVNMIFRTYILLKLGFLSQELTFRGAFLARFPASFAMTVVKFVVLLALESFIPLIIKTVRKRENKK